MGRGILGFLIAVLLCGIAAADDVSLVPPALTAVAVHDGRIIAGAEDGLLLRLDPHARTAATLLPADGDAIRALLARADGVYVLSVRGLRRLGSDSSAVWLSGPWRGQEDDAAQPSACTTLVDGNDALYLHGFRSIYRLAGDEVQPLIHSSEHISTVAVTEGTVWFGTLHGLYRWTSGLTEAEAVSPSQFGLMVPLCLLHHARDRNDDLFATLGAGLLRRGPDGVWQTDAREPSLLRLWPLADGVLALAAPARWRLLTADGWHDAAVPFPPSARLASAGGLTAAIVPGDNCFWWRQDDGDWEELFAGRAQVYYRGAPRQTAPAAAASRWRRPAVWTALLAAALLLSMLWRRRRAAAPALPAEEPPVAWQETPPSLPPLLPLADWRAQLEPLRPALEALLSEQERLAAEHAALPATEAENEPVQARFRQRTRELKERVAGQQQRMRDCAQRLTEEVTGLERERQSLQADQVRLETDYRERRLDRGEYRAWHRRLQARQTAAEQALAARRTLQRTFADVLTL